MKPIGRPARSIKAGGGVLAGVVALFAAAVQRFRNQGRGPTTEIDFTDSRLWDDDDGGLAAAGVPRRPRGSSGSGSAALLEPDDDPPPAPLAR